MSHALVAFAIEVDNEFEHQMPHRTTRHGSTPGSKRAPWLVSMAIWAHCLRYVPEDGIPAGELTRRARLTDASMRTVLTRMSKWWGYLAVGPDPADTRAIYTSGGTSRLKVTANILRVLDEQGVRVAEIPALTGVAQMAIHNWLGSLEEHRYLAVGPDPAGSRFKVARLTPRGRTARDTYFRWVSAVEPRWEDRFGAQPLRALRASIEPLVTEPAAQSPLWRGMDPYPDGWRAQVRRPEALPHYPVISARGGFPDGN